MTKNIQIIDNFLEKEVFKQLQAFLLGETFTWFYNTSKVSNPQIGFSPIKGYGSEDTHQFTHVFIGTDNGKPYWSSSVTHILPILDKIKPRVFIKVKLNLML